MQLVARAVDDRRGSRVDARELVVAGDRLRARRPPRRRPRARSTGACGALAARRRRARAAAGRRPAGASAARSAAPSAAASPCSPSSSLGEQLEVREHAGQRRAQLVRGVGDELALARERRLGLAARGVERLRASRPASRASSATSSSASRLGHRGGRGRACARSRARSRSARRSAPSRGARSASPPSSASTRAAEHAEQQEAARPARSCRVDVGRAGARTGRRIGRSEPGRRSSRRRASTR